MKVCFYIADLSGGGAEKVFLNLINYVAKQGHSIDLLLHQKKGPNLSSLDSSVTVKDLGVERAREAVFELARYLKKQDPDIAISTLSQCNFALILARLLSRIQTKLIVREANSFRAQRDHLSPIRMMFERLTAGILYRFANRILVNSKGSREELSEATWIDKNRIDILPNPLDLMTIRRQARKEVPDRIQQFVNSSPFVVAAGRLEKAKGFDLLIKSFAAMGNKKARLVIMGEGNCRTELDKLIHRLQMQKRILLAGFVNNPYPVMEKADLFVLSSRYEGMPNVLLEAMALGKPIVATDCPSGPAELLQDGRYGRLVPVGQVNDFAQAMNDKIGKNCKKEDREHYINQFDITKVGKKFMGMLSSVKEK